MLFFDIKKIEHSDLIRQLDLTVDDIILLEIYLSVLIILWERIDDYFIYMLVVLFLAIGSYNVCIDETNIWYDAYQVFCLDYGWFSNEK